MEADSNGGFASVVQTVGDVVVAVVDGSVVIYLEFPLDGRQYAPAVVGTVLWKNVDVVEVAVAFGGVVCHSVWPREVEGDARTSSLVVGM